MAINAMPDPVAPSAVSGVDVALVRAGRIAVLHTLLTSES
jgi:hypothetical protein